MWECCWCEQMQENCYELSEARLARECWKVTIFCGATLVRNTFKISTRVSETWLILSLFRLSVDNYLWFEIYFCKLIKHCFAKQLFWKQHLKLKFNFKNDPWLWWYPNTHDHDHSVESRIKSNPDNQHSCRDGRFKNICVTQPPWLGEITSFICCCWGEQMVK